MSGKNIKKFKNPKAETFTDINKERWSKWKMKKRAPWKAWERSGDVGIQNYQNLRITICIAHYIRLQTQVCSVLSSEISLK